MSLKFKDSFRLFSPLRGSDIEKMQFFLRKKKKRKKFADLVLHEPNAPHQVATIATTKKKRYVPTRQFLLFLERGGGSNKKLTKKKFLSNRKLPPLLLFVVSVATSELEAYVNFLTALPYKVNLRFYRLCHKKVHACQAVSNLLKKNCETVNKFPKFLQCEMEYTHPSCLWNMS